MIKSILFTQCLQNDYIKPVGKYDHIPNLVHIGYDESIRLMGENPEDGPVNNIMKWAYNQPMEDMEIIHIRDWHDPEDPAQKEHLKIYGEHCIKMSHGSRFAFKLDKYPRIATIVESLHMNDFIDTELEELLEPYKNEKLRIGIMGVMTESKISFLSYELKTRYPNFEIAVCSALCAGSSVSMHYIALDNLKKILGIRVIHSIGEFTKFLNGNSVDFEIEAPSKSDLPILNFDKEISLNDRDDKIIRFLFKNTREVNLEVLEGGYSGNLVFKAKSVDIEGREEAPHVLKIGDESEIGKERMSFEKVEGVLGNHAPRIMNFIDFDGRGGIKYRYASMGGGNPSTFKSVYEHGDIDEIISILDSVFKNQLNKFYRAKTYEKSNLIEYYGHDFNRAERLRPKIEALLNCDASKEFLEAHGGKMFPNPYVWMRDDLKNFMNIYTSHFFSYVHGDLNGSNIIIDPNNNVWLIDFYHTNIGHILKDLIKLENDILYIYTKIDSKESIRDSFVLSDILFGVNNLSDSLAPVEETGLKTEQFKKAYKVLRVLRSYCSELVGDDSDSLQLFIGQLRYSLHTLSFFESDENQKKWALYNSGHFSKIITDKLNKWVNHDC